jgi:predicted DNA-binding protein (MmcQ/YjbR family)
MKTPARLTCAEAALRQHALAYPETKAEFPWGHLAVKVKGKVFLFMHLEDGVLHLSVKLPVSGAAALALPFASPTGYGLGKSGWVSARFGAKDEIPTDLIEGWIDESFRAVAPRRVLAQLEDAEASE